MAIPAALVADALGGLATCYDAVSARTYLIRAAVRSKPGGYCETCLYRACRRLACMAGSCQRGVRDTLVGICCSSRSMVGALETPARRGPRRAHSAPHAPPH